MILKGTVRNVIDFGAFVDIGVHLDVDLEKKRISLSMKLGQETENGSGVGKRRGRK